MKTSLFSQSLFALGLSDAIRATAEIGFEAVELACAPPHLDPQTAAARAEGVAREIRDAGLAVSALSLFNPDLATPERMEADVAAASALIRLAPCFETRLVKLTPGRPGSAQATQTHWQCLGDALQRLIPVARENGVRLAVETHMRQLTDTLASSQHFLYRVADPAVGLTVDFLNLAFAGENLPDVVRGLAPRMLHTHVKNGYRDEQGGWHFLALDRGMLDYAEILRLLRDVGYEGYLSVECLGEAAETDPIGTARYDYQVLCRLLHSERPTSNIER